MNFGKENNTKVLCRILEKYFLAVQGQIMNLRAKTSRIFWNRLESVFIRQASNSFIFDELYSSVASTYEPYFDLFMNSDSYSKSW